MEKLQKTATRLDVIMRILQVGCIIAAVASLVGLALISACFLFHLDPDVIGSGYHTLDLGFLELSLAEMAAPDKHVVLGIIAANGAGLLAFSLLSRGWLGCVRRILAHMKENVAFHDETSSSLKKLALLTLIIGMVTNVTGIINQVLTKRFYHLTEVLLSDKVLAVELQFNMDLSFLIVSGVMLLLSYVFHYGQTLQQLSDETL